MKKAITLMVVLAMVLGVSALGNAASKKKSGDAKLTEGEESGVKLLALQSKGYISIHMDDSCPLVSVEPKFWALATHNDKWNLCVHAFRFFKELDAKEGKKRVCISVRNMTSREELARVEVDTSRIDIFK